MIHFLSKNKFRFARGYSYISMFAIAFLVVDAFEKRFSEIPFVPAFIGAVFVIWMIGYADDKMGFLNAEQSYGVSKNKVLMDGLNR